MGYTFILLMSWKYHYWWHHEFQIHIRFHVSPSWSLDVFSICKFPQKRYGNIIYKSIEFFYNAGLTSSKGMGLIFIVIFTFVDVESSHEYDLNEYKDFYQRFKNCRQDCRIFTLIFLRNLTQFQGAGFLATLERFSIIVYSHSHIEHPRKFNIISSVAKFLRPLCSFSIVHGRRKRLYDTHSNMKKKHILICSRGPLFIKLFKFNPSMSK